jgi:hypothetical protein
MQAEFSKIDMSIIQSAYIELSESHSKLLEFIKSPDEYMSKVISVEKIPNSLHFHVKAEGLLYPEDEAQPINQIVFSTTIDVPSKYRDDIISIMRPVPGPRPPQPDRPCARCRQCAIAIINWV